MVRLLGAPLHVVMDPENPATTIVVTKTVGNECHRRTTKEAKYMTHTHTPVHTHTDIVAHTHTLTFPKG